MIKGDCLILYGISFQDLAPEYLILPRSSKLPRSSNSLLPSSGKSDKYLLIYGERESKSLVRSLQEDMSKSLDQIMKNFSHTEQ